MPIHNFRLIDQEKLLKSILHQELIEILDQELVEKQCISVMNLSSNLPLIY